MASEDTFKLLPKELTELILSELEPVDLANSSGVSHHWRKLASNNLLWRKFFNDYHNIMEPLKIVYGNRKVNWMKRNYKLSVMKHPHGTFYIAKVFPNSNVLYTGCLSDVMEEWDMEKAEKICEYEVPTGPASNYRMDETYCLIERENGLKKWKRHKNAESYGDEPWGFVFENMQPYDNAGWIKLFQAYQFVRERCFMASVKMPGILIIHLYDMEKNKCLWQYELKVIDQPANDNNDLPRLEWDALSMTYDIAAIVYQEQVIVFDLNKHDVKFHLRDDEGDTDRKRTFSVCAIYKDVLLASKVDKTNFYSLKDGELLFSVQLVRETDYRHVLGWARMDGEKAVICSPHDAFLIDMQKQSLIGMLEWGSVSQGWTQDIAMNDDFFAVLASDEVVLFDFRKRTKEQEEKDAEELKKLQEEFVRKEEEERARHAIEDEEAEKMLRYQVEHSEEFPHNHSDTSSVASEEQPSIPPSTEILAVEDSGDDNAPKLEFSNNWGTPLTNWVEEPVPKAWSQESEPQVEAELEEEKMTFEDFLRKKATRD
jgi:hypothetical protein